MSHIIKPSEAEQEANEGLAVPRDRRAFLKWSGGAAVAILAMRGAVLASEGNGLFSLPIAQDGTAVDLGKGDFGILNYAYALEQLEAAFYTQVTQNFYSGATDEERQVLTQIRDHEIAHREFFKAALGKKAIPALQANFSAVDFRSRDSVLNTSRTFEDLGVSAYNGAGQLFKSATFLLLAGKIVSVEARHAAAIRDLLQPRTAYFSGDDVTDPSTGLDPARRPSEVLQAAAPFIRTPVTANNLPTS
ncbi:MAG: ferritin-like domain-containing protein [Pyrinomonadaceae bacterium]